MLNECSDMEAHYVTTAQLPDHEGSNRWLTRGPTEMHCTMKADNI